MNLCNIIALLSVMPFSNYVLWYYTCCIAGQFCRVDIFMVLQDIAMVAEI